MSAESASMPPPPPDVVEPPPVVEDRVDGDGSAPGPEIDPAGLDVVDAPAGAGDPELVVAEPIDPLVKDIADKEAILQTLTEAGKADQAAIIAAEIDELKAKKIKPPEEEAEAEVGPTDPLDELLKSLNDGRSLEQRDEDRATYDAASESMKHAGLMKTGRDIVSLGLANKLFTSPEALRDAVQAASGEGSPESIRALIKSLRFIDPSGEKTGYKVISERILVTGADGEVYSLSQIDTELSDSSLSPERRKQLTDARENGHHEVSNAVEARIAVADGAKAAERALILRINSSKGGEREKLVSVYQRLAVSRAMRGNVGAMVSVGILREIQQKGILKDATPPKLLESGAVIEGLGRAEMKAHLEGAVGVDLAKQMIEDLTAGRIKALVENPAAGKANLDKLLYGRELPEVEILKQLSQLTDPEKAKGILARGGKGLGLFALIALLMGVSTSGLTKDFD